MKAVRTLSILAAALLAGLGGAAAGWGQAHRGPPPGIPFGGPPIAAIGRPDLGMMRGGPPATLPAAASERARSAASQGLATAFAAQNVRLSEPQRARAASLAARNPELFELDRNGALAIRGEVLVAGVDAAALARFEAAGFSVVQKEELPALGLTLATVATAGRPSAQALAQLRKLAPQADFGLNHVLFESGAASAAVAPAGTETSFDAAATPRVGMIDTGVGPQVDRRPQSRLIRRSFVPGAAPPRDHGTAVATLLMRQPGPIAVYAADIFGANGIGGTAGLLLRALDWLAGQEVPVITVSMVGPPDPITALAVKRLVDRGFLIVAPVGNDGPAARPLYPASYDGVIAVSAAGNDGALLPEASRVRRVDFVGPGIASLVGSDGSSITVRGTSFAAPVVARRLAQYLPSPSPAAARRAVQTLARQAVPPPRHDGRYGHGLIRAAD